MEHLLGDLKVAVRSLIRARSFSLVAVTTLAVAIAANTAIFSVVDGVLLRPLPFPDEDRLVSVAAEVLPQVGGGEAPFSDRGYWHFVDNVRVFESFGGVSGGTQQWPLIGDGAVPQQVEVAVITSTLLELVGTSPHRGRFFTAEEDVPDGPQLALISHGLWLNRFGGDPEVIGRAIDLNGSSWEVVGVMPADYDFPTREIDVWVPYQLDPASENFGGHHIQGYARLAPGVTLEAAEREAEDLIARFDEVGYGPAWFEGIFSGGARVQTVREQIVGDARRSLLILLGTMGFVLLIACSNVANLFLVRAESRTRERAVRIALGSGRGRLIQYILMETTVLSLVGGLLGIGLAILGTRVLVTTGPASIPRLHEIGVNPTVLLYTLGISLLAGLLFGLLPALNVGSRKAIASLRDGGRGSTIGRDRHRSRNSLVIGQVALALVLLIGSGLMVRSFQALRSVDPGFDAAGILSFQLSPPPGKYADAEATAQFYDQLVERLEGIPGVEEAGGINTLPLTGGGSILTANIDDHPVPEGEFPPAFLARRVTPGYFETMGIPIVEGRAFNADDHNARLGSIIISASVKAEFWPDESAIGKRITTNGAPARVIGVVGDVHDAGLEIDAEQFSYKPMLDSAGGGVRPMRMVVRSAGDPTSLIPGVRAVLQEMDPDLPITDLRPMEEIVGDSLSRTSFTMTLLVLAAVIAVFLGSVGIYGVLSYVATQRTAEMGVRLALGAEPATVRGIILRQGMLLAGIGVALGLVGAVAMGGVMSTLLFSVDPLDPLSLVGAAVFFVGVAVVASLVPAARAARTPPAVALRGD